MATTKAPLMGFGASGSLAKAVTHSTWRGITYARSYAAPAYSRTTDQDTTRTAFSFLNGVYKVFGPLALNAWNAAAAGQKFIGRNAFIKSNLPGLRSASVLTAMVMSPGSLGGLPPKSVAAANGVGSTVVTITAPDSVPSGWTIASAVALAIKDADPQSSTVYSTYEMSDASAPYTPTISGLAAGTYRVFGWLVWNRPDGKLAYSPSVEDDATIT